jgi:lysophospholipase L1-like esterase
MPALLLAVRHIRAMVFSPEGTAPTVALAALVAVAWVGLTSLPAWRCLLIDIGRLLLARLHFVSLLLLTGGVVMVAPPPLAQGLGASLAVLGVAAAYVSFRQHRRHFLYTVVLLGLNGLALVALDAVVGAYVLPLRSHNNVFIEHDPWLGWKLRRGLTVVRKERLYTAQETINASGFRTRPLSFDKPSGIKRILFLGDSHTEGYTVNDAETYPVLVQQQLSATLPVEEVSLGVGGFSTDQELLAYVYYGRRYHPDVVVLQFSANDVPFNGQEHYWRGFKPRFVRAGDLLLLTGVPVPNRRDTGLFGPTLLRHSSLVVWLESLLRQFAIQRRVTHEVDWQEAWQVTALLLRDLARMVQGDGAQLVVFQADRDPEVETRLRQILAGWAIPYVDTSSAYSEDFASYWVADHWNQRGHRAIAAVLSTALRPYVLGQP